MRCRLESWLSTWSFAPTLFSALTSAGSTLALFVEEHLKRTSCLGFKLHPKSSNLIGNRNSPVFLSTHCNVSICFPRITPICWSWNNQTIYSTVSTFDSFTYSIVSMFSTCFANSIDLVDDLRQVLSHLLQLSVTRHGQLHSETNDSQFKYVTSPTTTMNIYIRSRCVSAWWGYMEVE